MFPRFTLLIASAWFVFPAFNLSIRAQVSTEQRIVVEATPQPYEIPKRVRRAGCIFAIQLLAVNKGLCPSTR